MDKEQILIELDENLKSLDDLNKEIFMTLLAIYQKRIEKLKNTNIKEFKHRISQQAEYYSQNISKYNSEIEKYTEEIEKEMDLLVDSYDEIYVNVFQIMQNAINNQKVATANVVTSSDRKSKEELSDEERNNLYNTAIACAQKKLNYAVIENECYYRLKWCIKSIKDDFNNIFVNSSNEIAEYKDNVFTKLRRFIFNKISGKKNFKKFLKNIKDEHINSIIKKNKNRREGLHFILLGIIGQMEITRKNIVEIYEKAV